LNLLLVVQKSSERVQPLLPELAVASEPFGSFLHWADRERAADDPAHLFPLDESRILENAQVLHESGQRHAERPRQLGHRTGAVGKPLHHFAARRVGERREDGVERLRILNHKV